MNTSRSVGIFHKQTSELSFGDMQEVMGIFPYNNFENGFVAHCNFDTQLDTVEMGVTKEYSPKGHLALFASKEESLLQSFSALLIEEQNILMVTNPYLNFVVIINQINPQEITDLFETMNDTKKMPECVTKTSHDLKFCVQLLCLYEYGRIPRSLFTSIDG